MTDRADRDLRLTAGIDALAAETGFSGVVRVDVADDVVHELAYGMADRRHGIANAPDTQFGIASGTKVLTALTITSLVELGALQLSTTARSLLGADLLLVHDDVTIEHLLGHRSGIGDYLDEDTMGDIDDYAMPVPVHQLATTEEFLAVLDGHPAKFAPGEQFSYCNGGYVLLALLAERATGMSFHDLVEEHVCRPAEMHDTAFLRSDELPGRAALGYLGADGLRTNVLHLPVRGNGDGGVYTTAADVRLMWTAFLAGSIVSPPSVAEMTLPRSITESHGRRYGLGFWLHHSTETLMLEGYDPGVSFRTVHDPHRALTHTVVSNTSHGAWPLTRHLDAALDT
jgi:CubicO group peptidase (beta-lactamase class C family)